MAGILGTDMTGLQQAHSSDLDSLAMTGALTASLPPHQEPGALAWYCARTKPKHEHIAAANLRRQLGLETFNPRLRLEQTTCRGVVKRVSEPLFPCYVFVRCVLEQCLDQVRHTSGISSLVHFGDRIPEVPEAVIQDLRACFGTEESLDVDTCPCAGDGVTVTGGAFLGMQAVVLRAWPAKRRVAILLEVLGQPTRMEVDASLLAMERRSMADFVPMLAAPELV